MLHRSRALVKPGARNIRLFGSLAGGDDSPASDIDPLVDVSASVDLFALGRMRSEAERILGSSVDNVPANSLGPDIPWTDISGTRNQLAQRSFDTAHTPVTPTLVLLPGIVEPSGLKVETFAVTAPGHHFGRPAVPFVPRFNIVGIVCDSDGSIMVNAATRSGRGRMLRGQRSAAGDARAALQSDRVLHAAATLVAKDSLPTLSAARSPQQGALRWRMMR